MSGKAENQVCAEKCACCAKSCKQAAFVTVLKCPQFAKREAGGEEKK